MPQMIAAPTFQLPQLRAFSGGAQTTEAAANLANQLLQAYLKKQELNKGEAASSELADLLAVMDVSQDPSISAGPVQDPSAYAAPSQADQYDFLAKGLLGSKLTQNREMGQEMLIQALLKEPKELTREEQIGEVLRGVPKTKQAPAFGPLADPEQAFSYTGTMEVPLSPAEQTKADYDAIRAAGLHDMTLAEQREKAEITKEFAKETEDRGEQRTIRQEDRAVVTAIAQEHRAVEIQKEREIRAFDFSKKLEEMKANLEAGKLTDTFDEDQKLRKEYTDVSKAFVEQKRAYERLISVEPTAAGDMALIFNYMKVLDPGSTVREGEYANARNAGSWGEGVRNLYNQAKDGTLLQPRQRMDFHAQAENLFNSGLEQHKIITAQYEDLATAYGLDPRKTIIDFMQLDEQNGAEQIPAHLGEPTLIEYMTPYDYETGTGSIVYDDKKDLVVVKVGGALVPFTGTYTYDEVTTEYKDGKALLSDLDK